jgi:hypothetical protein
MLLRSMPSLVERKLPEEKRSEASDASGKDLVALAILTADPSGWCWVDKCCRSRVPGVVHTVDDLQAPPNFLIVSADDQILHLDCSV